MVNGPQAALVLAKRHMPLRDAHAAITLLFESGQVVVDVPVVENAKAFVSELAKCNVVASLLEAEAPATSR